MQVNITGRHVDIKDSLKEYVINKLSRLEKYTNKIIDIKVIFDIQDYRNISEIIVSMKDKNLIVKKEKESLIEAFDVALEKMQKQIKRYWEKRKLHNKK